MAKEKENENKQNLIAGAGIKAIIPRDVNEAWQLAKIIVGSGMVPDSYKGKDDNATGSKVMIGIQKGLEIGLPPMAALSNIMIINNRPVLWGDGALAVIQNSGKYEWHKEWLEGDVGQDNWTAHCEIKRIGQNEPIHRTFSFADAKRAKLTGKPGPWMSYPQRMLQMRARAWAIRDGFADCLSGLSIAEEISDMPEEKKEADTSFLDDRPTAPAPLELEDQSDFDLTYVDDPINKLQTDMEELAEQGVDAVKIVLTADEPEETITDEMVQAYKAEQQSLLEEDD